LAAIRPLIPCSVHLPQIEEARAGYVEALARGIIEELRAAGLEIRRTDAIPIRNPYC
jgi:hypothetical protein